MSWDVTPNSAVVYRPDPVPFRYGTGFGNREPKRLVRARERGYLDARCRNSQKVTESFGRWCWRLKIPLVWFERQTPRSKYGRVGLEMFTTSNRRTATGEAALTTICVAFTVNGQARVSPYSACCDRVPLGRLDELARIVFRAATRAGHYEPDARGNGQFTAADSRRAASA